MCDPLSSICRLQSGAPVARSSTPRCSSRLLFLHLRHDASTRWQKHLSPRLLQAHVEARVPKRRACITMHTSTRRPGCAGTHFSRHATARKFPSEHKHARTCKAKCGLGHAKCCHCVVLLRPAIALLRLPGPPPPHPCDPARHVRGPRHVSKRCARPRGSCGAVRQADAWQSHGSMMRDVTAWGLDGYAFDSGLVPKPSKDPSAGGFQTSYSLQLHTTRIN